MAFGKRQLVLAALVVALGAAVYLNWQFSDNQDLVATDTTASQKELGQAQYVNTLPSDSSATSSSTSTSGETATSQSETSSEYFAQTRISRQKSRDEATELLKDVLESADKDDAAKKEAVEKAAEIAQNIEQETNIENLVKAKGFKDCVAFIQNGECSIVVLTDGLLDSEAITIKDIVLGQSGIGYDKIKIVESK